MENIKIAAKALGQIAMPNFCERCFWIKQHSKKLPWQIFPGIFYSIDSYTKKIVHRWIENKTGPEFLKNIGVTGYLKVPHWSKFKIDTEVGITISGVADDLLVTRHGIHIPDYKTAKFTATHDKLFPMYQTQINVYAKIGIGCGMDVCGVSLIYMEPQTDENTAAMSSADNGFVMPFVPHFLPCKMDVASIDPLLERARKIYDGDIPDSLSDCKDCQALKEIVSLL